MKDAAAAGPVGVGRGGLVPQPVGGLVVVVLVLLAALLLREVGSLLVPLLFGVFLALVSWPLVAALERRNVRRALALAITVLAVLVVVVGAGVIIALSVGQLVVLIPTYEDRLGAVFDQLQALLAQAGVDTDPQALLSIISPEQVVSIIRPIASALSGAGVAILVLVLTMAYALAGGSSLQARAQLAFGADHALLVGLQRFSSDLRRYLVVRAALGLFAAVLVFILLFLLSVPLPALWAFLVFAASFIPNIGTLLALIPPAVLALLDSGVGTAVLVVIGYVAINFVQDNFLQPIVLGTELNLTPLVAFVGVIVWAWILGAAGALLAVPLTVGLVAILEAFPASQPLAALMRNRVDAPAGLVDDTATRGEPVAQPDA